MLEYGWVFVTGILTLLGGYLTYLNIKEKKNQPMEDLIEHFSSLSENVSSLNNTLSNLNEKVITFIDQNDKSHQIMVNDIKDHDKKLNEHETRITVLEKDSERSNKSK